MLLKKKKYSSGSYHQWHAIQDRAPTTSTARGTLRRSHREAFLATL